MQNNRKIQEVKPREPDSLPTKEIDAPRFACEWSRQPGNCCKKKKKPVEFANLTFDRGYRDEMRGEEDFVLLRARTFTHLSQRSFGPEEEALRVTRLTEAASLAAIARAMTAKADTTTAMSVVIP